MRLKAAKYSQPARARTESNSSALTHDHHHRLLSAAQLEVWSSGGKIAISGGSDGKPADKANHLLVNLNSLTNFGFAQNIVNYVFANERQICTLPNESNLEIKLTLAPTRTQANKVKQLARSIMESVEASARIAQEAATQLDCNRALQQAREALAQLEALRAHLNARDSERQSSPREELGLELGASLEVSVLEMSLMVDCNLAERLQSVGQPQEALEIYTRLCKLSSSLDLEGATQRGGSLPEARSLLCRFGLNIGNILTNYLGEHKRALKHYRLTLDRLAASGPHLRQLRLKLMSNIGISLLALGNLPEASQALNLLLADNSVLAEANVSRTGQQVRQQQQQQAVAPSSRRLQVFNWNQHKFALNLAVCHHERADSGALMSLLKSFVDLDISSYPHCQLAPSQAQASPAVGEDRLEWLIGNLLAQTRRSLLTACKLLVSLEGKPADGCASASFQFCAKLLAARQIYRSLLVDLQASNISSMLADSQYEKLDQVIRLLSSGQLVEGEHRSREAKEEEEEALAGAGETLSSSSRWHSISSSRLLQPQIGRQPASVQSQLEPHQTSAVVANHESLVYQLQRDKLAEARKRAEQAIKLDETNASALVNLANCHLRLNDLELAADYYKRALELQPTCWAARYNLMLVHRKLGRPPGDQFGSVSGLESKQVARGQTAAFILEAIQFAYLHYEAQLASQQSKDKAKKALTICQQLIESTKTSGSNCAPPEIYLLASKLIAPKARETNAPGSGESQQVAVLQSARRDHPSSLAVLERLIALHISNFEYGPALKLLNECIELRPDQARWYQMIAECYRRSADYKSAIEAYKIAIELFPRDSSCLRSLAKLADELGLIEEQKFCHAKLEKLLIS